jgi:RNA polymerase sigma factor (sigma-70 family)
LADLRAQGLEWADIAQDVVLDCLVKIRNGTWDAPDDLPQYVRRMVQNKRVDLIRRRRHRDERDGDHAEELEEARHAWMAPDQMTEERELLEVHERALSDLPDGCRRAYIMVRDSQESYTAVGKPYKLALRADATRRAVADALAGLPGTQVDTAIDDGSVVTTVTVAADTDTAAVAAVLNQYALRWHLNVPATDSAPVSD